MTTSNQFDERYIGNGAMGNVYELVGHKPLVILDQFTAICDIYPAVIKYMFCKNVNDKELKIFLENFKNECEALKKIYHVNVVRLYRYTEEGKTVGIVMEYCEKGSLKGVLLDPTIRYSMNTVLTWGVQLFDAIHHMYQKHKLVHRDIKPDNIFVANEYQLKIGDFGLVKVVGDGTVTGTFVGTPRYMSPPELKEDRVQQDVYEQIKEADVSNSHRNDVYSLGLVMWEIIERRTIFTNYDMSGGFDRDQLLIDIALERLTEIEPPECQSEIQEIILRCTNFQRIHRPLASEVRDFLQTYKANPFISSLPFMPTEDKNQKELMKPIGFDDRTEWVMVGSEERKYEKRFAQDVEVWPVQNITKTMRDKLGTLNPVEREKFLKEAPNIVSRLKEETQTFKDARYVIGEILELEEWKGNIHEKKIYEIFELFVLGDFQQQIAEEHHALGRLKSHEEIWISSFKKWWWCDDRIDSLKEIRREKYTTNFYFRCFISQLTGEGWIQIERHEFVSEDLRLHKRIPEQWVDNPRSEIRSYEIENEGKKHEMLHFSHYKQIPLERIIEAFKKQQKRMETIMKLYLKYLIPIEDSEKNNVPFNIGSLLDESSEYERFFGRVSGPHPFPHYIFQGRNPPRPICQKNHPGKCQMDGFRKKSKWFTDLPEELHIPVCGEITENEARFLDSYLSCIESNRSYSNRTFDFLAYPFLFLCCLNLLEIPFLILLDHPNNYENGESIPGFDLNLKLHNIDVGVLREYFQELKLEERAYALIGEDRWYDCIRLIDYEGNPKTKWQEFENVTEFGFLLTDQQEKLESVVEDKEVTKKERKRKKVSCSVSHP